MASISSSWLFLIVSGVIMMMRRPASGCFRSIPTSTTIVFTAQNNCTTCNATLPLLTHTLPGATSQARALTSNIFEVPGTNSNGCLTLTVTCAPLGSGVNNGVVGLLNIGLDQATNFAQFTNTDCGTVGTNTVPICQLTLVCSSNGTYSYTSAVTGTTTANVMNVACVTS